MRGPGQCAHRPVFPRDVTRSQTRKSAGRVSQTRVNTRTHPPGPRKRLIASYPACCYAAFCFVPSHVAALTSDLVVVDPEQLRDLFLHAIGHLRCEQLVLSVILSNKLGLARGHGGWHAQGCCGLLADAPWCKCRTSSCPYTLPEYCASNAESWAPSPPPACQARGKAYV